MITVRVNNHLDTTSLARRGEYAHSEHRVLADARVQDEVELLTLDLVEALPRLGTALVGAESDLRVRRGGWLDDDLGIKTGHFVQGGHHL